MKTAKRFKLLFGMLALPVMAMLIASCCSDCPTGPGGPSAYRGWLYATNSSNNYLYRIDTETDKAVDSMRCELSEDYMPGRVVSSSDGKYLAVSFLDNVNELYVLRLFDAQTWELISEINVPSSPLFFIENNSLLLDVDEVNGQFIYYSVPNLVPVDYDPMIYSHPNLYRLDMIEIDESKKLAYIIARFNRETGPQYSDSVCLYAYNYIQKEIEHEWIINIRDNNGDFYMVARAALDTDRSRIYVNTSAPDAFYVVGYDYGNDQVLFRHQIESCYGDIVLTPNKKEIYVVDPGMPGDFGHMWTGLAGTLYVFDAETGAYTHGISLYGFTPNYPDIPMFGNMIAFTPTGDKAYVGSGRSEKYSGTVCSINTSTYAVENLVWPDFNHMILFLEIGPK